MCVHLLDKKPPETFLVSAAAMRRLNYQTRVIAHAPPVIAARIGDTLIVGFDHVGSIDRCPGGKKLNKHRLIHRFDYTLSLTDCDDTMLATRIK